MFGDPVLLGVVGIAVVGERVGRQAVHVSVIGLHVNPCWQRSCLQTAPAATLPGALQLPSLSHVNLGSQVDPLHSFGLHLSPFPPPAM